MNITDTFVFVPLSAPFVFLHIHFILLMDDKRGSVF